MCLCVCVHVCAYVIAEWWGPFPRNYKTLGIQGQIRKEMTYSNESPLGRVSLQSEVLDVGVGRKCRGDTQWSCYHPSGEGRKGWCDLEEEAYGEAAFRVTFRAEVWRTQGYSLSPVPLLSDQWFPTDWPRSEARFGRATSPLFWLLETKYDLVGRRLKGLWTFSLSVSSYCWQRPKNP